MPKNKRWAYVINFDEYADVETHWITLYVSKNVVNYFDSFRVEEIPGEIRNFIENKHIETNISRIQKNDSITCRNFCIGFINSMLPN